MHCRVEELAAAVGLRVDTLRFYQSRGLLPPPDRVGRVAIYGDDHLQRLERIRDLKRQGLTLAQIQRVLARNAVELDPLMDALEEGMGPRRLSRSELASQAGVPEALIQAGISAGLLEPLEVEGEERFADSDVEMARAGLSLLEAGFPLQELVAHAVTHAQNVQQLCDDAIELFDAHIRKRAERAPDTQEITEIFRHLLPQVTRLVAVHFQRTLVTRALNRLRGKQDVEALEQALRATEAGRLEVEVTWR